MKRLFAFAFVAAITNFGAFSYLSADDVVTQRGFVVFAPGSSTGTYYEYRKVESEDREQQDAGEKVVSGERLPQPLLGNLRDSLRRRPLFFRVSDRPVSGPSSAQKSQAVNSASQRPT